MLTPPLMPHEIKNANEEMPPVGVPVQCVLQFSSGKLAVNNLIHVDEDDVTLRTADDRSEINEMAVDVISWTDIPQPPGNALADMLEKTGPVSVEEINDIHQEVERIRRDLERNVRRSQYCADRIQRNLQILEAFPLLMKNLAQRLNTEPGKAVPNV